MLVELLFVLQWRLLHAFFFLYTSDFYELKMRVAEQQIECVTLVVTARRLSLVSSSFRVLS